MELDIYFKDILFKKISLIGNEKGKGAQYELSTHFGGTHRFCAHKHKIIL